MAHRRDRRPLTPAHDLVRWWGGRGNLLGGTCVSPRMNADTDNSREPVGVPSVMGIGRTNSGRTGGQQAADPNADFADYVRAGERHHRRLAFLLTGDLDEADDLLQSAYAKVYPRWERIQAYDAPDAYLRKVMVTLRTSWWRRHRNRERTTDTLPELGGVPDAAADVAGTQTMVAALRRLPERQRAAVVLRHWCDLSEAETADVMGCSVGTVKSSTSKGLAHLRTALGRAEGEAS